MTVSAAEWKRRQEKEDAELWYFDITWGEFRVMTERQQNRIRQRYTQYGATYVGFWKDCNLAKCRRAKRCSGFLTEAQYARGYPQGYPPCTRAEEARRAKILYDGLDVLAGLRSQDRKYQEPKYNGRPSDQIAEDDESE